MGCIKKFRKYHDLYVQSDTLLADIFENFRNKCIEIYERGLAWQACLKTSKIRINNRL